MIEASIEFLGDSALLVRVPDDDDAFGANRRVHALATQLRARALPGVRDLVPGMRDLVVHVDALRCDFAAITRALQDFSSAPAGIALFDGGTGDALIQVPVVYGGAAGPDLDAVAAACHLSTDDVCRRHAATTYRVCFIGFLPGFPYLGPLDPALRLPRRPTPRPRVPAGSVAIGGEYSGIYPWTSPGGWHIIGRTDVVLFDLDSRPPTRLAPGAHVRFVPA